MYIVHDYVCTYELSSIAKYNLFYYITIINNNGLFFIRYCNFRIQISNNWSWTHEHFF